MISTEGKIEKRYILIFAVVVLLQIILALSCQGGSDESYTGWNEHQGIIRMHVIANSNSQKDQQLKLKVRDKVIEYVGKNTKNSKSIDETRLFLMKHRQEITDIAYKTVRENGYSYDVDVQLGVRWIKEKNYGDITLPAGNYEALNITIGKGWGENWWCVLFPPLCLVKDKNAKLKSIVIEKAGAYKMHYKKAY